MFGLFPIFQSNGRNKLMQFTYEHVQETMEKHTAKLSFLLLWLSQDQPNTVSVCECVRTLCLVRFSSSNQTWVSSRQSLNPIMLCVRSVDGEKTAFRGCLNTWVFTLQKKSSLFQLSLTGSGGKWTSSKVFRPSLHLYLA